MPETRTVEIPEEVSEEDLKKFLRLVTKKAKKVIPYIGYSCGKTWLVTGRKYEDARAEAIDKFIEEFRDVLPPSVPKSLLYEFVSVRKLGPEWLMDIEDTIKTIHKLHNGKERKTYGKR